MNTLIYFNESNSTNDEIIDFIKSNHFSEGLLAIYTFNQTKGKGQYGNTWQNFPYQNIAYSLAISSAFQKCSDSLFNFYTAIILRDFLANLTHSEVKIKWPNDLLIKNKKISGMLIEKKNHFTVIGIGINVLQENFYNLPKAGSIFTQTSLTFDLKTFVEALHQYFIQSITTEISDVEILEKINQHLFKKDEISVFEINGIRQNGIIQYVDSEGYLWVKLENDEVRRFFHKEIEHLY